MRCPRCQVEVEPAARFCEDCGARLEQRCPACDQPVTPGKSFCRSCGASLGASPPAEPAQAPGRTPPAGERAASPESYTPPHLARKILTSRSALTGERKQVTVLFCDLVGSTALAERLGPDAMHELLDRFFGLALAEVHRYEGTLNQFLGDGFMALFGAPIAHEDHARRAALAALAIRRTLGAAPLVAMPEGAPALRVRMGLNTGLVVVGAIGDNLRMDYTAVGDTTHLAARLQQLAEPGDVLLSDATARLVEGYVTVEPRGEVSVRGLSRPQPVHRLTGPGQRRSRLDAAGARGLSPFVGRARELAALEEVLERVRRGQGQVVGVVGEAGLGKSRLLLELRQAPGARDLTWLEGRCLSYGATIPYLPVTDAVRAACGIVETDEPGVALGKLRDRLDALGIDVTAHGPYLAHLLGLKGEDDGELATLGADVIMERTFDALRQLVLRSGRERPTVLAVEDLHWVDRTSESVLASLADGLARAPVLLVATYRPGYRPAWLDKSYATQLALDPLAAEDSLAVLRSTPGGTLLGEDSLRPVLDRAEGNPFFLEELARVVGEPAGGAGTPALPETVQDVLVARIDRLPEATKRVLQTAAVLGREFPARLLAAVWEGDGALEPHLLELTRLEFLHERPDLDEPAYAFKHALTQEVAATTLLGPQRQALHRRAAGALPGLYPGRARELAPVLVHHALRAGAWPEAVRHARDAAEAARAAYANEEARAYYDQGLDAAERAGLAPAERRGLLEARASIHEILGAFDPARADLEAALELAGSEGDVAARARLLGRLGALWGGHRDYERGLSLAEQAVALLRDGADPGSRAEAHARLGIMLLNVARMRQSRAELARARALWRSAGDRVGEARAHEMLAMNLGLSGHLRRACLHAERAVRGLAGSGLHADEAGALLSLGSWRAYEVGLAEGEAYFRQGLEVARRAGLRSVEAFAHGLLAETRLSFGAYGRSHAGATACLEIAEAIGHREWATLGLFVIGRVHHACGDAAAARRLHERTLALARELRTTLWIAGSLQFLGQDLLLAGDLDGAAAHFAECLSVGGEEVKDVAYAMLGLAEVALARHRPDEALALVERYGASGDWPVHLPDAGRLRAAALVEQGRWAEAERALVEARDLALSLGAAPGAWRARLALARLLHEAGRSAEARAEATAARDALEGVASDLPDAALRASLEGSAVVRDARALAAPPG